MAIGVSDLERTLEFYQTVFDMTIMYHEENMIQLTTPGCHDILVFEKKSSPILVHSGIAHFGFRLRSPEGIDVILKKLESAGATIIDRGEFVPGSPYVFFMDPDGYIVEVWYELLP